MLKTAFLIELKSSESGSVYPYPQIKSLFLKNRIMYEEVFQYIGGIWVQNLIYDM